MKKLFRILLAGVLLSAVTLHAQKMSVVIQPTQPTPVEPIFSDFDPAPANLGAELQTAESYPYNGFPHYSAGSIDDSSPWLSFEKDISFTTNYFNMNNLSDRYEVTAYAAQARSFALGATAGVGHLTGDVNLTRIQNPRIWPPDTDPRFQNSPYGEHFYHSAEFRGDYPQQQGYWNELLGSEAFSLK